MKRLIFICAISFLFGCGVDNMPDSQVPEQGDSNDESAALGGEPEENKHSEFWYYFNKDHGCGLGCSGVEPFQILASIGTDYRNDDREYEWGDLRICAQLRPVVKAAEAEEFFTFALPIIEHMDAQIEAIGLTEGIYEYIYDYLTDISIKASVPMFGRASNEELRDCFVYHNTIPQFSYPEGNIVDSDEWQFQAEVDDIVGQKYFVPYDIDLRLKEQYIEYYYKGKVTFEVSVTLASGLSCTESVDVVFY